METGGSYRPAKLDEVRHRALRILKGTASFDDRYVQNHKDLVTLIEVLRSMGCIIGFTTGTWDLFHIGHADYIQLGKDEVAKRYPTADHIIMVVGVDTDEITKKRKGPDRPIVPQAERVKVLGHIRPVDILTLQSEEDQLFKIVEHDVRVVSTSTTDLPSLEKIRAQCAFVVNLPPQAETSTTARVRQLSMDGAAKVLLNVEKKLSTVLQEVRDEIKR